MIFSGAGAGRDRVPVTVWRGVSLSALRPEGECAGERAGRW